MSSKHPVIGKPIASGFRLTGMYATTPLEFKVLSPTGVIISRNMGGVGLGIVAALENVQAKKAGFGCRSRIWSHPIPVNRSRPDHTIVNSNKPNKSRANSKDKGCIFTISPARFGVEDVRVPQPAGFLNSCHLCNKRLHGKDIYMYRGEKAFCSPECRSRQIAMDERPEKYCSTQASSSGASRVMATGIFAI